MRQLEALCAVVPPPDPGRLARARAQVLTAIAEGPQRDSLTRPGRRWPGRAAPLAAAAAVAAVLAGVATVSTAIHGPGAGPQAPAVRGILTDVSCPGPAVCVAVGQYYQPGPRYLLIERRAASRWTIVRGPALPALMRADLNGVACADASECVAVGTVARATGQPVTGPSRTGIVAAH